MKTQAEKFLANKKYCVDGKRTKEGDEFLLKNAIVKQECCLQKVWQFKDKSTVFSFNY